MGRISKPAYINKKFTKSLDDYSLENLVINFIDDKRISFRVSEDHPERVDLMEYVGDAMKLEFADVSPTDAIIEYKDILVESNIGNFWVLTLPITKYFSVSEKYKKDDVVDVSIRIPGYSVCNDNGIQKVYPNVFGRRLCKRSE